MMKKYIKQAVAALLLPGLAACGKESPFTGGDEGAVSTAGITVELASDEGTLESTRAAETGDFTVEFIRQGSTAPVKSYRYSEMPDIVELPVGTYTARAHYGDNPSAAWDAPYYVGTTLSAFEVVADQITEVADPIVCYLSNVKVTVFFDDALAAVMGPDAKVSVKVGEDGNSLNYTLADQGREGYFAYAENSSTLAATFSGEVEGFMTNETKVYDDVSPGNHYKITFTLHTPGEEPGDITADLNVDAKVTIEDINRSIGMDDDILEDDMRPKEEGQDPPAPGDAPEITAKTPLDFDKTNDIVEGQDYVIYIQSKAGIRTFTVDIDSETLTPEELQSVGLATHLDLVNPGDLQEALEGLQFPVNVGGRTDRIEFNLTTFAPLLSALGPGISKFSLTVSDANGTTSKTLILRSL